MAICPFLKRNRFTSCCFLVYIIAKSQDLDLKGFGFLVISIKLMPLSFIVLLNHHQ